MTKLNGWTRHGEFPESACQIGALLKPALHFLRGAKESGRTSIAADLAVALAAGEAGGGYSTTKHASLAGFFGRVVGSPVGVAIIGDERHATAMPVMIDAARAVRGVTSPLPIMMAEPSAASIVHRLYEGGRWLHDMRDELPNLGLIVIDEATFGHERVSYHRLLGALQSVVSTHHVPALAVTTHAPAEAIGEETVVLDIASGALSWREPGGRGWKRAFTADAVKLNTGEARAVRVGREMQFTPQRRSCFDTPPAARAAPVAEPVIAERVALLATGRTLTAAERAEWIDFRFVRDAADALHDLPADGLREVLIVPTDRDGRGDEAGKIADRLRDEALRSGVAGRVAIRVSERRVAAWA